VNHFCFLNFNNVPPILDNFWKFYCLSGQTFSETLRISEKGWQLSPRFSKKVDLYTSKGGQTAILVRWSAAQRTTEMLADQRQRTTKIELPLVRC
jgi:hypothetical protein